MRRWRGAIAAVVAVALTGCAVPARRGAIAETTVAAAPASPMPVAPIVEPPRQADQLARVASELADLQNAIAKLMIGARQHDDQLGYLTRRLADLENLARGRAQNNVPGFAPGPSMPTPLPPPPMAPAPFFAPPAPSRSNAPAAPSAVVRALPAPAAAPMPSAGTPSTAEGLYQAGLAKYQAGDLDGAVVSFYEVVSSYPRDPARERAQFLIGEIFYTQKDYRGAVAELESLISAVPAGRRVADALLKIGMAQRSLGDEPRARRTWERLMKEHPASAAARQARTLLRPARG